MRFGKCVKPSEITSVMDVGTAVGICADEHMSDMHALRDVRNPSVFYVGKVVSECGTIL